MNLEKTMIKGTDISVANSLRNVAKSIMPSGGQVWLYGSRARGEATEQSDWDILILLNQQTVTSEDEDKYAYPFVVEGWKYNCDVNPQIYTFQEWKNNSFTPYHKNVEKDKISLL